MWIWEWRCHGWLWELIASRRHEDGENVRPKCPTCGRYPKRKWVKLDRH